MNIFLVHEFLMSFGLCWGTLTSYRVTKYIEFELYILLTLIEFQVGTMDTDHILVDCSWHIIHGFPFCQDIGFEASAILNETLFTGLQRVEALNK